MIVVRVGSTKPQAFTLSFETKQTTLELPLNPRSACEGEGET